MAYLPGARQAEGEAGISLLGEGMVTYNGDTIVALSTGSGRGALSIVRLSGPQSSAIAQAMLDPYPVAARYATLAVARDPRDGQILDQLIAVRYDAPASYTGEAMLELSCHGGSATSRVILGACFALGARAALPGEFTRRALLNGKMDLAQAEALPDLIDATSEPMRRIALGAVGGGLSKHIADLRNAILHVEAVMAYSVDFPEEDDGEVPTSQVIEIAEQVHAKVANLLNTAGRGMIIREGAVVVFAGPPNVGKSSLFNSLLGQDRAIVTDIAGTTRDAIEHPCLIGDWPLRLVDTAGLRAAGDLIERLGIETSEKYLRDADLAVVCSDGTGPGLDELVARVRELGPAQILAVQTKGDQRHAESRLGSAVRVSVVTGEGLDDLRKAISQALEKRYGSVDYESPTITQARHREMLQHSASELQQFIRAMENGTTPTIAGVHLRSAAVALEEIIGAVSVDDLLDELFSRFCVGK
ncbi:MAG: tRNA uridine-5-carboxymethylaminomethyl(34) synthesis GTPase MnmE [Gemmatimonadota bacterium]